MVAVVQSNDSYLADLISGRVTTPPEVVADNAARAAKAEPEAKEATKEAPEATEKAAEPTSAEAEAKPQDDDAEDEEGLTAAQRREFTQKMQRTISKKHREMREAQELAETAYNERTLAQQRADKLERELAAMKAQLETLQKPDPNAGKPKRESFETDAAYQEAVIDWQVEQRFKEREEKRAKEAQEAEQRQVVETAKGRIDWAMEHVPDFRDVVEGSDLQIPPAVAGYMQRSELFAELAYHFAQNPDEVERLQRMRPDEQLVALGELKPNIRPFPRNSAAGAKGKANGVKPSADTASDDEDAAPVRAAPSSKTESSQPAAGPSKPRAVIRPLSESSGAQVEKPAHERSYDEEKAAWARKNSANLAARKRH